MSSPNHPTSNIEDAFSSNFPDYIPASPDYVPASPGKTYSSSSNNSFGLVPIASPTLSLFHDDPYMKDLPPQKRARFISPFSTDFSTTTLVFELENVIIRRIWNVNEFSVLLDCIVSLKRDSIVYLFVTVFDDLRYGVASWVLRGFWL
ncbi:hypothetical protein Tco_1533536 [Tanacetum coccineum]